MSEWTEAVTHPLGLAGFALFLIFSLLTARKRKELPRWKSAFLLTAAVLALVSGLGLAVIARKKVVAPSPSVEIRQSPNGNQSPAAAATGGGQVTININSPDKALPKETKNAEDRKTAGQEQKSKKP